jgi:tRNA A64-2'-O-ribosylphosphate transferase
MNAKFARKDDLNLKNRILSILNDSHFIDYLHKIFPFPILANERSGSWYVRPELQSGSVYFKSTDGHFGQWNLSLKRLNLFSLEVIHMGRGAMIVDVTRRGKRFPDSLSKTIPIWCFVLNQVVFSTSQLFVAPTAVSPQEKLQIERKLGSLVEKFKASNPDIAYLKKHIKKPLRPIFLHPSSKMFAHHQSSTWWTEEELQNLDFTPLILVSASISNSQDEMDWSEPIIPLPATLSYVQGASDDCECWFGAGFNSSIFWKVANKLTPDLSIIDMRILIQNEISSSGPAKMHGDSFNWMWNSNIAIGNRSAADPTTCWAHFDYIANCGAPQYQYAEDKLDRYLYLDIPEGKKGQKAFSEHIEKFLLFIKNQYESKKRILIHCMQGKDHSVGMAMCFFIISAEVKIPIITKQMVTNLLIKIQAHRHQAAPSRATLKKLNLYFIAGGEAGLKL